MESNYTPRPIATEHVELNEDLLQLVEMLAENAHDLWALQRLDDGWAFGPERCDTSLQHPCLVPYSQLGEDERVYDRNIVLGTIRAVLALGFTVSRDR